MSEGVFENNEKKPGVSSKDNIRTRLEEIFRTNMDTYGHGTRVEAAKEIIREGLKAKSRDLDGTAIFLFDHKKPFEEQIDGVLGKINKWPHLESKAIIIIVLPRIKKQLKESIEPIKGISNQIRTAPFFRKIPGKHDASYGLPYVLPPNYIKGFMDVERNEFIGNPLFSPIPPDPTANQGKTKLVLRKSGNPVTGENPSDDLLP